MYTISTDQNVINHFKWYLQIETKFWTTAGEKPSKSSKMTTKGGWSTRLKGIWIIIFYKVIFEHIAYMETQ